MCLTGTPAASGASATIASDALMNPFDGERMRVREEGNKVNPISCQATHAASGLLIHVNGSMRKSRASQRRILGLLHLLPHYTMHDRTVYGVTIHGL